MHNVVLSPIDLESLIQRIAERTADLIKGQKTPPPPEPKEDLLTPKEACGLLRITSTTLWRYEKQGKIKVYGIGAKRYYKRSELMESLTAKR